MSTQTKTRTGGVLAATCLSTLVVNANTSAVSILLPAISEDTGMSVDTLQWAVTGYSLVGAAVIVTSGALGDVFGRKRIFQLGLALFVVSCVLIALANTGEMVIVGRLIHGAAGPRSWLVDSVCFRSRTPVENSCAQCRCGVQRRLSARPPDLWSVASWSTSLDGKDCSGLTPGSRCSAWC